MKKYIINKQKCIGCGHTRSITRNGLTKCSKCGHNYESIVKYVRMKDGVLKPHRP